MNSIFVFGSNLAGVHGAGAAKTAHKEHGANWGIGIGRSGNSYAIPTKNYRIQTLDMGTIELYVQKFLDYARNHDQETFKVTRIGCGLAGLNDRDIAPLFYKASFNCQFDEKWKMWLPDNAQFWGTF